MGFLGPPIGLDWGCRGWVAWGATEGRDWSSGVPEREDGLDSPNRTQPSGPRGCLHHLSPQKRPHLTGPQASTRACWEVLWQETPGCSGCWKGLGPDFLFSRIPVHAIHQVDSKPIQQGDVYPSPPPSPQEQARCQGMPLDQSPRRPGRMIWDQQELPAESAWQIRSLPPFSGKPQGPSWLFLQHLLGGLGSSQETCIQWIVLQKWKRNEDFVSHTKHWRSSWPAELPWEEHNWTAGRNGWSCCKYLEAITQSQ